MAKQSNKKVTAPVVNTFDATQKNRDRKLAKHLKAHPADAQAAKAVDKAAPVRKKSVKKGSVSMTPVYRLVTHVGSDTGFANVVVRTGTYGEAELFHRGRMRPNDYADQVRKNRAPTHELLKATRGAFGNLKQTEQEIKDNTRALCAALGIHYTGRVSERKPYKGKRK